VALGEGCFCAATFSKGNHSGQTRYRTALVEKEAKGDIVRELLAQIAAGLMDFEIDRHSTISDGRRLVEKH